jgi:hypothetical protein
MAGRAESGPGAWVLCLGAISGFLPGLLGCVFRAGWSWMLEALVEGTFNVRAHPAGGMEISTVRLV